MTDEIIAYVSFYKSNANILIHILPLSPEANELIFYLFIYFQIT